MSGFANVQTTVGGTVERDGDSSSDYGSSYQESDTTSISSSIYNHVYENGRRYHAYRAGNYVLPNDEQEQNRLDLLHHIFLLLLDGELLIAPIKDPQRVLDLGTGTGIWAMDVADKYPSAEVIGIDLSPIQPNWIPPNLRFEIDNFEEPWRWGKDSFDLVHARTLAGDWPAFYTEALNVLKPGGTFEVQEAAIHAYSDDGTFDGSMQEQMSAKIDQASKKIGKVFNIAHMHKQWMIDAGFVDVEEKVYMLPCNTWPKDKKLKELGKYQMMQQLDAVEPLGLALFTRVLGMPIEEVTAFNKKVTEELLSRRVHAYTKVYFVYGRKPEVEG